MGVVHTKFQNAKLQIEERMVDNHVIKICPAKGMDSIHRILLHLRDYLIIWAVGSILGVTKEVDMEFTR
jgi:hypothetical protein